jgi:hypothetical protein
MGRSAFPGFPAFLEHAAKLLGFAPALVSGAPPAALAALSNLCAQASTAEPRHVPQILEEAASLRDRLIVAAKAAELMMDDVSLGEPRTEASSRPRSARPSNRPSLSRS